VRAGVEARPFDKLRVEAAVAYEGWGVHDAIRVDPQGVALKNVIGFPERYYIPSVNLPRNFQGAFSARFGGEYAIPVGKMQLDVRAGVGFETSAVPNEYLSVLTIDSNKIQPSIGAGLHVGALRLDLVVSQVIMFSQDVDPKTAKIAQVSPVVANAPAKPNIINGGSYSASATVIGLGASYSFGKAATAKKVEAEGKTEK